MNIGENLHQLRIKLGLSQPAIAEKFNIKLSSWKKYEAGTSEPGAGALQGLAEGGININWLLTGEGEMLLSDQVHVPPHETNTTAFMQVLERLSEDDFEGRTLGNSIFGYLAMLVYIRVMFKNRENRQAELETCVKELNLILLDQALANIEFKIEKLWEKQDMFYETIEPVQKIADDYTARLGASINKFAGRPLSPGSKLEAEFLKGLNVTGSTN